ncbi:MAG TPA: NAD(P)H-dependent oxidoreductase [Candidatus Paceibacterota bacterium]|nr:NAD(P)H-dependent oxidoreductase [Candidatus Paceibacterota bacterium]
MRSKKILVLLGHPDNETVCGYFADRYEAGAREAGHEVRRVNIGDLQFDPILHKGYKEIQALEPDLVKLQEDFRWAEHIAIVYPNWWSTMPALLKGLFDRMFLPGFAFKFMPRKMMWKRLLEGRTARVIITMNNWPLLTWWMIGDYSNEIRRGILWFAGIWPVRVLSIGRIEHKKASVIGKWGARIYTLGAKAK